MRVRKGKAATYQCTMIFADSARAEVADSSAIIQTSDSGRANTQTSGTLEKR